MVGAGTNRYIFLSFLENSKLHADSITIYCYIACIINASSINVSWMDTRWYENMVFFEYWLFPVMNSSWNNE